VLAFVAKVALSKRRRFGCENCLPRLEHRLLGGRLFDEAGNSHAALHAGIEEVTEELEELSTGLRAFLAGTTSVRPYLGEGPKIEVEILFALVPARVGVGLAA